MKTRMDQVDAIMALEQGELSQAETIKLFQNLLDSGLVWKLQGSYGRAAHRLLEMGLIHQKETKQEQQC